MNIDEFQTQASKSVAIMEHSIAALAHRTLDLTGEAGIVANKMKKIIRDKQGIPNNDDVVLAQEKLGDTLYYVAVLAEYFDLTLADVAQSNLDKSADFLKNRSS